MTSLKPVIISWIFIFLGLIFVTKLQGGPLPRNFTKMGYSFVNTCHEGEIPLRGICRKGVARGKRQTTCEIFNVPGKLLKRAVKLNKPKIKKALAKQSEGFINTLSGRIQAPEASIRFRKGNFKVLGNDTKHEEIVYYNLKLFGIFKIYCIEGPFKIQREFLASALG
ncbi:unnamed protein product [Ceutorhynchus assimilis]|uniref:Uncharacterized protein n=1 Tax=Ceutorhynchus assimilis TaxID=467358 RepID=A0A9N9MFR3_9CUCU|nr:unnamed protein product [Ceutorhynchus assimilis]